MTRDQQSSIEKTAQASIAALENNTYPGRGIVLGQNTNGQFVQVYWIMGRSTNSRNRIFRIEGDDVATEAADPSKLQDPSLIIYYPVRVRGHIHIVTNGDQTDTILAHIEKRNSGDASGISSSIGFLSALQSRQYEPDGPNFTPRISGLIDTSNKQCAYQLSILKAQRQIEGISQRNFYLYEQPLSGFGHCITTYQGDGSPLPTFDGDPFVVPVQDDIERALEFWWKLLNEENRISLLVKFIDPRDGKAAIRIKNKYTT